MPRPKGNGPGYGGPAKGLGHGGPATGDVRLHGPAKGAGVPYKAPQFEEGNTAGAVPKVETREQNKQRAAALMDHLYTLATTAENEMAQIRAAEGYLNRVQGLPVARNINVTADDVSALDDDALALREAELERELRQDFTGAPPSSLSH